MRASKKTRRVGLRRLPSRTGYAMRARIAELPRRSKLPSIREFFVTEGIMYTSSKK